MASATAFDMPETISGESPATVPFKKPEPEQPKQLEQSKQPDKSTEVLAIASEIFHNLEDARDAYEEFIDSCNWKKNPTFAFFVWASEHNWVEDDESGDCVRLDGRDPEFYDYDGWSEDMRSMTDERWKMDELSELVAYETTRIGDYAIEHGTVTPDVPTQATDATTAADSHDEKFWRELEIMAELRTAEIKRQEASTAFDIKTEERKEAKEYLASCTAALARVTAKLVGLSTLPEPKKETQVGQGGSVEPPVAQSEPQDLAKPNISQPTITEPEPSNVGQGGQDNSWRIEPTANIIEGLPGLGSKKFDAIVELCPTVGDLEDKRAEAAKDFLPFKAALPKGCGESIANAIEDALLAYIGRFGQQVKAAKSEPEPAEPPKVDDDLADL